MINERSCVAEDSSNGAAENFVLPQQDKKIHLKYIKIEK